MRKRNIYFALIVKFGTLERAAKALGTKPEVLERRCTGESPIPLSFGEKVIKALGIGDNAEAIEHVLFAN